jgi:hypothetical protein
MTPLGGSRGRDDTKVVGTSTFSFLLLAPISSFSISSSNDDDARMPRTRTYLRDYWPRTSPVDDLKAALFEFVGTTMFLLLAFGGTQASHEAVGSTLERSLYIATAFGLSLLVSAWFFFRATGGLFNPDVSLALLLVGCIGPTRFILYCIAQMVGAIAAAGIVLGLTPGALSYKYVFYVAGLLCFSHRSVHSTLPQPTGWYDPFLLVNAYLARSPLRISTSPKGCLSRCLSPPHSVLQC